MEEADKIKIFYDKTENRSANESLRWFLKNIKIEPGKAVDLGCGAGRDTRFLLQNGWKVQAIDKNDVQDRVSKKLDDEESSRLIFSKQEFEKAKIRKNDLFVANFSLSFCDKAEFENLWAKIVKSMKQNRIFCG